MFIIILCLSIEIPCLCNFILCITFVHLFNIVYTKESCTGNKLRVDVN